MKKTSETIVFFGSGPVAAASLELLLSDFAIEAVITKPGKSSRDAVPVIDLSKKNKLAVFDPQDKTELDSLFKGSPFNSTVAVLIDYGIIVPQAVIDYFKLGIVNSHFSLLPEWRGADPITFSILSGQSTTGVSLMLINAAMDEGELIDQRQLKLSSSFTTPVLTEKLIKLSHNILSETLPKYISGLLKPYPQPLNIQPSYSRKLTKDDGRIDWNKTATQIEREVRAFINWPGSTTLIKGVSLIITKAHVVKESGNPGDLAFTKHELIIYASKDALSIDRVKPAGKKDMDISAFLAGYKNVIG